MFTFDATPVKYVGLLVLFAWCTAWCGYELTRDQDLRQRISNVLHLVMAVVMLLMVPRETWQALVGVVPASALVVVFAAGTGWFVWLAVRALGEPERRGAAHFAGHAMMFGAMTWHLSAMAMMAAAMSGMRMGGGHGMEEMGGHHPMAGSDLDGVVRMFALVGLPFMAYLLAASGLALWRVVQPRAAANDACPCGEGCTCGPDCACSATHAADAKTPASARELELTAVGGSGRATLTPAPVAMSHSCHEERPVGSRRYRLAASSDFAMNFGMFWMSTGLLTAILPFFAVFAF